MYESLVIPASWRDGHVWTTGDTRHPMWQLCMSHRWYSPFKETIMFEPLCYSSLRWDSSVWATGDTRPLKWRSYMVHGWFLPSDGTIMCESPVIHTSQRAGHVWDTNVLHLKAIDDIRHPTGQSCDNDNDTIIRLLVTKMEPEFDCFRNERNWKEKIV